MKEQVIQSIKETKVIAILRKVEEDKLPSVAKALYDGGLRCLEITFNQGSEQGIATTQRQIAKLAEEFSGRMFIGAGTVMNAQQVQMAKDAGATFVISPNVNEMVIKKTNALDMVSIPGAMTPTEIISAYDFGADFVKVFPALELGCSYFKAMQGPLSYIPMLAVGSITLANMKDFAKAGCCGFGIGGELVNKEFIANNDFAKLTSIAKEILLAANNND